MHDGVTPKGKVKVSVIRADGKVELVQNPESPDGTWPNLFTSAGMDYLAVFQTTAPGSVMNHMLVGTISTAATLTDVVGSMGEVARVSMATRTTPSSNNVLTEVATFGGTANGITSVSIREVGVVNDARSGPFGALRARAIHASTVLANSDFVRYEWATTCGSRA